MTPLLTFDNARELTLPFHDAWVQAHLESWALWSKQLTENSEFVKALTPGDRYLILHRHVTDRAARYLEGRVTSTDKLDFFAQIVRGQALVRFKHLDTDLKTRNYPTDQQKHLDQQAYTDRLVKQLALEGVEGLPTVVTCGYTLNPAEDGISRIVLTCRNPRLLWCISLYDSEAGTGGGDLDVPSFPSMPPAPPRIISTRTKVAEGERDAQ
ncbi:MAG: hypothetical protein V9E89_02170 [Ilumatobacteraceae bacterium]